MIIDFDASIVLIFIILYIPVAIIFYGYYKKSLPYLFLLTLFAIYVLNVLNYTQFPIFIDEEMRSLMTVTVLDRANYIPIPFGVTGQDVATIMLNMLLMIPLGFLLPFLMRIRVKGVFFVSLGVSAVIEVLQLGVGLATGISFRVVDINDVIANSVGGVVGFGLFILFIRVANYCVHTCNVTRNAMISFMLAPQKHEQRVVK